MKERRAKKMYRKLTLTEKYKIKDLTTMDHIHIDMYVLFISLLYNNYIYLYVLFSLSYFLFQ